MLVLALVLLDKWCYSCVIEHTHDVRFSLIGHNDNEIAAYYLVILETNESSNDDWLKSKQGGGRKEK